MMTNEVNTSTLQTLTDAHLAAVFGTVDRLHDLVSAGKLAEVAHLPTEDLVGWLQDVLYTVSETLRELEQPNHIGWEDFLVLEVGGTDV
jgi:hypothetical protein